mgnify:CR=1 FL=1
MAMINSFNIFSSVKKIPDVLFIKENWAIPYYAQKWLQ